MAFRSQTRSHFDFYIGKRDLTAINGKIQRTVPHFGSLETGGMAAICVKN
jgi:hypothetical protein